uniref:Uncharacterized protein n=1 Tax=Oryza sativa subsp. japonica TaxID=39947 RepID=Q6ZJQ0_ORYSJ|nr:hypothetical protein [Oryza sativa Japonica Group]
MPCMCPSGYVGFGLRLRGLWIKGPTVPKDNAPITDKMTWSMRHIDPSVCLDPVVFSILM